ncbi:MULTISPECIES: hypothetical protein [Providencia]|uniref:hypothetical protein n=1 Tax=Providencia TaxID=586 RepID=UPI0030016916
MNQSGVLRWAKLIYFSGIIMLTSNSNAESIMKTNYVVSFNAHDTFCMVKVNDILITDNTDATQGNYIISKTISSLLNNGANTLSVTMPSDSLKNNMWCSATIKEINNQTTLVGVKLIVEDKEIKPDENFYSSKVDYFGSSPRANSTEEGMLEITKTFLVKDLPDWNWTKGRPITDKDIPQVKAFYQSLQEAFKQQDLDKIYEMTKGMWEILAKEQGCTPQKMWDSMNFKKFFEQGYKYSPVDWNEYELNSYMNGRLFRYEVGYGRISPIEIQTSNGDFFSLDPYLSIIDGKVIVVR